MAESTFPRLLLVKKYPLALLAMKDRIRDCGVLRMSNRACSSVENAEMCRIITFYEYQIALVAVENAEIFKILAYYEYQITLVAMRKTRKFAKPCPITNIKSRL